MACRYCGSKLLEGEQYCCASCGKANEGSIGASKTVRDAKIKAAVTGTTYVIAGLHGFRYRQSLGTITSKSPGSTRSQTVFTGMPRPEPETAPAEEFRESTASELIENLNRRAKISTAPAIFVLAASLTLTFFAAVTLLPAVPTKGAVRTGMPQTLNSEDVPKPAEEILASGRKVDQTISIQAEGKIAVLDLWSARAKGARQQRAVFNRITSEFSTDPNIVFSLVERDRYVGLSDKEWPGWTINLQTGSPLSARVRVYGFPTVVIIDVNGRINQLSGNEVWSISKLKKAVYDAEAQSRAPLAPDPPVTPESGDISTGAKVWLLAVGVFGAVAAGVWRKKITQCKQTNIIYKLDEAAAAQFSKVQSAFVTLSQAKQLWQVLSESPADNWKRNAGTSTSVMRTPAHCGTLSVPSTSTNISVVGLNVGSVQIYPLPDQIFYLENGKYGAIKYPELSIVGKKARFVETGRIPDDAKLVGETWKFANKNGGPDLRFKNNRKIPVMEYGHLSLTSTTGFKLHLYVSSPVIAFEFVEALTPCRNHTQSEDFKQNARNNPRSERPHAESAPPRKMSEREQAAAVLGISCYATAEEISIAYRNMAQLYHPDKVAGLGPKLRALADQQMKEINWARDILNRSGS